MTTGAANYTVTIYSTGDLKVSVATESAPDFFGRIRLKILLAAFDFGFRGGIRKNWTHNLTRVFKCNEKTILTYLLVQFRIFFVHKKTDILNTHIWNKLLSTHSNGFSSV